MRRLKRTVRESMTPIWMNVIIHIHTVNIFLCANGNQAPQEGLDDVLPPCDATAETIPSDAVGVHRLFSVAPHSISPPRTSFKQNKAHQNRCAIP